MKNNIVYILTNELMPGIVKIGMTDLSLSERVRQLSSATGVPVPFEVFYACEVNGNAAFVEKQLHDAFADARVNFKREFFRISPERVLAALKIAEISKDVTPDTDIVESKEEQVALDKLRETTGNFDFNSFGIPVGSVLTFTRDSSITCKVHEDGKSVIFRDVRTSAALAAKIVLRESNPTREYKNLSGSLYWEFNGEILDDIRRRYLEGN